MTNSVDSEKPTGLNLHCLQRQGISEFSRTRVKYKVFYNNGILHKVFFNKPATKDLPYLTCFAKCLFFSLPHCN